MTVGTGLAMWPGEFVIECGTGNGMPLFTSTPTVTQSPSNMFPIAGGNNDAASLTTIVAVVLLAIPAVAYIEQA